MNPQDWDQHGQRQYLTSSPVIQQQQPYLPDSDEDEDPPQSMLYETAPLQSHHDQIEMGEPIPRLGHESPSRQDILPPTTTYMPPTLIQDVNDIESDDHEYSPPPSLMNHRLQSQEPPPRFQASRNPSDALAVPMTSSSYVPPPPFMTEGDSESDYDDDNGPPASIQFERDPLLTHTRSSPLSDRPIPSTSRQANFLRPPPPPHSHTRTPSRLGPGGPSRNANRYQSTFRQIGQSLLNAQEFGRVFRKVPGNGIITWKDVKDLDSFLYRLYEYYRRRGYLCIVLSTVTFHLTGLFVLGLSTFLLHCVDYSSIHKSKKLVDSLYPNCPAQIHWMTWIMLVVYAIWFMFQVGRFFIELPLWKEMRFFYHNILDISEDQLQATLWNEIVERVIETRAQQLGPASIGIPSASPIPVKQFDSFQLSNIIMRRENYMIALFNKDLFPLDVWIPFFGKVPVLSKLMEWNLWFCIFGFVFDSGSGNGSKRGIPGWGRGFKTKFLREVNRSQLVEELKQRFRVLAMINLVFCPIILLFMVLYTLFKFAEEYQQRSSSLAGRQYTSYARWKFREFNELPHFFEGRLNRSIPNANKYLTQFPKMSVVIIARFVSFIFGVMAASLLVVTLFEEEMQQGFEITPGRSAFFYIGLFGTILAISRSLVPEDSDVPDPAHYMKQISLDTHYLPEDWKNQLHSLHVRNQFSQFYDYKVFIFLQEVLSVLITPYKLYVEFPGYAERIVDFFREFTVHVDGVGYVCSFAVFDFKRHGNTKYGVTFDDNTETQANVGTNERMAAHHRQDYTSENGKMEQSFLNFKAHYPEWTPDAEGSAFLTRVLAQRQNLSPRNNAMMQSHVTRLGVSPTPHYVGSNSVPEPDLISSYLDPQSHPGGLENSRISINQMTLSTTNETGFMVGRVLNGLLDAMYEGNRGAAIP